jgi:hypothetical protein
VGGTDGILLDCLLQATPHWAWPIVGIGVAVMILLRPVYNWLQKHGIMK